MFSGAALFAIATLVAAATLLAGTVFFFTGFSRAAVLGPFLSGAALAGPASFGLLFLRTAALAGEKGCGGDKGYRGEAGRKAAKRILADFAPHLRDAGVGTVSEIFDGDAPHHPRGCIAQAWGVAELLRACSEDIAAICSEPERQLNGVDKAKINSVPALV